MISPKMTETLFKDSFHSSLETLDIKTDKVKRALDDLQMHASQLSKHYNQELDIFMERQQAHKIRCIEEEARLEAETLVL